MRQQRFISDIVKRVLRVRRAGVVWDTLAWPVSPRQRRQLDLLNKTFLLQNTPMHHCLRDVFSIACNPLFNASLPRGFLHSADPLVWFLFYIPTNLLEGAQSHRSLGNFSSPPSGFFYTVLSAWHWQT